MFLDGAFLQLSGGVPGARAFAKPEIRAVFGSRAVAQIGFGYLVSALAAAERRTRRSTSTAASARGSGLQPAISCPIWHSHLSGNAPNLNDVRECG